MFYVSNARMCILIWTARITITKKYRRGEQNMSIYSSNTTAVSDVVCVQNTRQMTLNE